MARYRLQSEIAIATALVVVTLAIYGQVLSHHFVGYDDDVYITANPIVQAGVTRAGIAWAFTTFTAANWHPLTWLSHMIDMQLFRSNAGAHLFVSALIHCANVCLLFIFLRRVTGKMWQSAMVAALFALHPLHVESVAWAAERKDTLSIFFGLLSLLAYARYATKPSLGRYTLVAIWLVLGLLAKPILVTWPFVFLLLDCWPLGRFQTSEATIDWSLARRLLIEKIPFFVIVALSSIITYIAQSHGGAVAGLTARPISWRLANAAVSYAKYLFLTFWPTDLAVLYPAPRVAVPTDQWAAALLLLSVITAAVVYYVRTRPYALVGWLFFLGTLVPVIGLVRIGSQAIADRYTYIPSIGLFLAVVFGLADLAKSWRIGQDATALASLGLIVLLGGLTSHQLKFWRDSEILFRHALAVTSGNAVMHYNLGCLLQQEQRYDEAASHFAEAVRIWPDYTSAIANLGFVLRKLGKPLESVGLYERALKLDPNSLQVRWQLGEALEETGKYDAALVNFAEALRLRPRDPQVHVSFGVRLARRERFGEAQAQFEEALRLDPHCAEAHENLGFLLLKTGEPDQALDELVTASLLKPDLPGIELQIQSAREQVKTRPH